MIEQDALAKMVPASKHRDCRENGILHPLPTSASNKPYDGCSQRCNLDGKPVMMTVEEFEQDVSSWKNPDYFTVTWIFTGPSLRRGTRVFTTAGIFPIDDLDGKVFEVRNLRGEISPACCRLWCRKKPLYQIRLRGGAEYQATAEHQWPALELVFGPNPKRKDLPDYCPHKIARPLGNVATKHLRPGMRLPILRADSLGFGTDGNREDGFLAGWLYGDGWFQQRSRREMMMVRSHNQFIDFSYPRMVGRVRQFGLAVNADDYESGIGAKLIRQLRVIGTDANFGAARNRCHELHTACRSIDAWMDRFGITAKAEGIPPTIWSTASEDFRIGFLDGLFSSDGNVELSKERGFARIRLTNVHEKLTHDVADLLGFYGIKTAIRSRTRLCCFPNGKDYGRTYSCYELSIEGTASVEHFTRLVRLTHDEKQRRLEEAFGRHKADVESDNIEIVSVERTDLMREDVWGISVGDDTHCFQLAHCITGHCSNPNRP